MTPRIEYNPAVFLGNFLSTLVRSPEQPSPPRSLPGHFTFMNEGNAESSSPWFSRRAHHPSFSSGVTIGRGYDMRERHAAEIFLDLTSSGLEPESAEILSGGAGLSGTRARNFISGQSLPEISSTVEENLFSLVWGQMEDDVERLVSKPDVVERYGATDWETLNPVIRDIVVDLRFRGDFTPRTRTFLQSSIVANDLSAFAMFLSDRSLWQNVPRQRFEQRMKYLSSALAEAE